MNAIALDLDFEYPTYPVRIDAQAQAEKLACCDIDPGVYGEYVDITQLAAETIMAARHGGVSINGSVHVSQDFEQRAPLRLGETFSLSGKVTAVETSDRGDLVTSRFEVARASGDVPLVLERVSLRADPKRMGKRGQTTKPVSASQPVLEPIGRYQLQPDKVARYSNEAENLIHSDPEVARQFGFKAPIAGGTMAIRFMMAYLWRQGAVETLRMSVRFRRPMFWDDELLMHSADDNPKHLLILRANDGKVANDARVGAITLARDSV